MPTFATDVSYYQVPVDDRYPHQWLIFRSNDGTFRDPTFSVNYAWAKAAAASGKLAGFTVYVVYRPGQDTLGTLKSMVGTPDPHMTVMVDVESWGGQIGGNRSADITALANGLASWLGDQRRVLAYGNQNDLAALYPNRPSWLRLIVAGYSSQQPSVANMIGWQYSDGQNSWPVPSGFPRSTPPFGACDHNVFPNLTPAQLADALGVGTEDDMPTAADVVNELLKPANAAKLADLLFSYRYTRDDGVNRSVAAFIASGAQSAYEASAASNAAARGVAGALDAITTTKAALTAAVAQAVASMPAAHIDQAAIVSAVTEALKDKTINLTGKVS